MNCPKCKAVLPSDSFFCQKCGTNLISLVKQNTVPSDGKYDDIVAEIDHGEIAQNLSEKDSAFLNAIQKRIVASEAEDRKKKKRKITKYSIIAFLVLIFICISIVDSNYKGQLRNFATETMDTSFTNVYADVVFISPEYLVYSYTTRNGIRTGEKKLDSVLCKCKTIEGKYIWANFSYSKYPGYTPTTKYSSSSYDSDDDNFEPCTYSYTNPMRLNGRVKTTNEISADAIFLDISEMLVLNVSTYTRVNSSK